MREARVNGRVVQAGADSPDYALCPACGAQVHKRKRKNGKRSYVFFYRHDLGAGEDCPLRYRPGG